MSASPRIIFGSGSILQVGEIVQQLKKHKVLIVTDRGIVNAGHAEKVERALDEAGISFLRYDKVRENPTTKDVACCVEMARSDAIDLIIGLGGGSSMDTAKGCNFILTNGGEIKDYWGIGKAGKPMLPLIAIPTTAGTGSECQSFALIADELTHQKMACGDVKARAKVAILDPELTLSQPRRVSVCTGMDALSHALESAVTKSRTPISSLYSRESFSLIATSFPKMLADENDLNARASMLLGAALAGLAIENSMLGATHSAANPLTAHFNAIHGEAIGCLLPHVIAFNSAEENSRKIYNQLWKNISSSDSDSSSDSVSSLLSFLKKTLVKAKMPTGLHKWNVAESDIPMLSKEAASQWTARFNPRFINASDFQMLYQNAMKS